MRVFRIHKKPFLSFLPKPSLTFSRNEEHSGEVTLLKTISTLLNPLYVSFLSLLALGVFLLIL
jgi:hypothetical protein